MGKDIGGELMSKLVCHVMKFGASDIKGLQIHNQRETQKTLENNPDIDPSRISQNYDLHTGDRNINYNHAVKNRIKEGYTGERAVRKDAVTMVGVLVSSDREFFNKLSPEQQREFFKTAYDYVAERYGRENIIAARVHMDETTPHMHLHLVPLTADGRLSAKELFDRKNLLKLQQELPMRLQQAGFDIQRGEGRDPHKETIEWKREQAAKELIELRRSENELHKQKAELDSEIERLAKTKDSREKINAFEEKRLAEAKNRLFGSAVHVDQESFKYLCKNARAGVAHRDELKAANQKIKQLTERIEANAPKVLLGNKTQAMLDNDPKFKRQFQAAEVRREKTLAEKMANKIAQAMPQRGRSVGLRLKLGDDDDERGPKYKL